MVSRGEEQHFTLFSNDLLGHLGQDFLGLFPFAALLLQLVDIFFARRIIPRDIEIMDFDNITDIQLGKGSSIGLNNRFQICSRGLLSLFVSSPSHADLRGSIKGRHGLFEIAATSYAARFHDIATVLMTTTFFDGSAQRVTAGCRGTATASGTPAAAPGSLRIALGEIAGRPLATRLSFGRQGSRNHPGSRQRLLLLDPSIGFDRDGARPCRTDVARFSSSTVGALHASIRGRFGQFVASGLCHFECIETAAAFVHHGGIAGIEALTGSELSMTFGVVTGQQTVGTFVHGRFKALAFSKVAVGFGLSELLAP